TEPTTRQARIERRAPPSQDRRLIPLRHDAVATDVHARGLQRAVGLLDRTEDRNSRAGLELTAVAGHIGAEGGLRWNDDFLLAILVPDHDFLATHAGNRAVDGRVGHGAARPRPRPMTFAGTAHGLRKDRQLDGLLAAVRLRHGADADEGAGFD